MQQGLRPQMLAERAEAAWQGTQDALTDRLVLFLNHLLRSEPVAQARLRPHVGRRIHVRVEGLPAVLPPVRELLLEVTPAALLEKIAEESAATQDARPFFVEVTVKAALDAVMASAAPTQAVRLDGDAALATDLAWLIDHLRWDLESDLAGILPPTLAHGMVAAGRRLGEPLVRLAQSLRRTVTPER